METKQINLNKASQKQLEELNGVGYVIAQRIIELRDTGFKFKDIYELSSIKGIGKKKIDKLLNETVFNF